MAEYSSQTISKLLKEIDEDKIILPAMQRNFVWPEDKITHLFDSLMRDYPIGTFLFWEIDDSTFKQYVFNQFVRFYSEKKGKHQRGEQVTKERSEYVAVLDGQQRITSLYIGIRGSYKTHIKGKSWTAEDSFIDKYLCLNVFHKPQNADESYEFAFQVEENIDTLLITQDEEGNACKKYWVKVSQICDPNYATLNWLLNFEKQHPNETTTDQRIAACDMIDALKTAVNIKNNVNYYPAANMDLAKVVEIFVRVNSGGQKLSASDLLLSVATGEQGDVDMFVKMEDAISVIKNAAGDEGFQPDNEVILTAALMFTGAGHLSLKKKENYSRERVNVILENWDNIIEAIANAAQYIGHIGFKGSKLTSKNSLLPIAYYFYKNNLDDKHKERLTKQAKKDRIFIRQWLLRSMINKVFMDDIGSTLLKIRSLIDTSTKNYFPLDELMLAEIKHHLYIGEEQIEDILTWKYGDVRIIPLLMDLAKIPANKENFQADHIWPQSKLTRQSELRKLLPDYNEKQRDMFKSECHYITNLQLLNQVENLDKSDRLFGEWVEKEHPDKNDAYFAKGFIPNDKSYNFEDFPDFIEKRKKLLADAIRVAFPKDFADIVARHNLDE